MSSPRKQVAEARRHVMRHLFLAGRPFQVHTAGRHKFETRARVACSSYMKLCRLQPCRRVDPKIIAATKKMEKKAAAGRLTAAVNMQRGKRAAAEAGPGAVAAAATPGGADAAPPEALATPAGAGAPGGGVAGTAAGPGVAAAAASAAGGGSGGGGQVTPGTKAWGGGPGGAGGGAEAARAKTYEELEAARYGVGCQQHGAGVHATGHAIMRTAGLLVLHSACSSLSRHASGR